MATIEERYAEKFAKSVDWYHRGQSLFAGGGHAPDPVHVAVPDVRGAR